MFALVSTNKLYSQEWEEREDREASERHSVRGGGNWNKQTPGERAKMLTDRMVEFLDVKKDQVIPLLEVNKTYMQSLQVWRENADRDRKAMKKIRADYQVSLAKILTEDQLATYKKMMESRRGRRRN